MKLGIYGGSFDPPHLGHLKAAAFFQQTMALSDVMIIPADEAPLKQAASLPGQLRLELCRLTFPYPVSDIEVMQSGKNYTVDTLHALRKRHPTAELFLLIGTDQLGKFKQWHRWQEILQLCQVCVLQRDETSLQTDLPVRLLSGFAPVEISSTTLRGMLAQGQAEAANYLTPKAYAHIQNNKLYLEPNLPEKRLHHSRCVAKAAEMLAHKYGADPKKARFAGLWHDCAKYFADDLSHAGVGAEYLAHHMGILDEEILSAVRWHTVGKENMSKLSQIVFVADKISADRSYEDIETVRELAHKDLQAATDYILDFKRRRYAAN